MSLVGICWTKRFIVLKYRRVCQLYLHLGRNVDVVSFCPVLSRRKPIKVADSCQHGPLSFSTRGVCPIQRLIEGDVPGEAISNRRFIDPLVLERQPCRVLETLVTIKGRWYRGTAFLPDLVDRLAPSTIIFMQASTTPLVPFTPFAPFAFLFPHLHKQHTTLCLLLPVSP